MKVVQDKDADLLQMQREDKIRKEEEIKQRNQIKQKQCRRKE